MSFPRSLGSVGEPTGARSGSATAWRAAPSAGVCRGRTRNSMDTGTLIGATLSRRNTPMPAVNESKILILATSGFEQSELEVPRERLRAAGATVHVASPEGDDIRGWDKDNWGNQAEADLSLAEARAADYDAVVLPGGQINPDILRTKTEALELIRDFAEAG